MCMKLYQYVFVAMYIFSLRYLIVFSVLTITAFLEDAIRIFEECLPKIGEVKTMCGFSYLCFSSSRRTEDFMQNHFVLVIDYAPLLSFPCIDFS